MCEGVMPVVEQGCLVQGFQEPNPHWIGNPEKRNGNQRTECWLTPQSAGIQSFYITVLFRKLKTNRYSRLVTFVKDMTVFLKKI